jgi:hypothetical protein
VDCPPQVCDSKDPYPPPPNMGAWSCDQDMLGNQTCDDLDDLTQMILPLNAECCDEPTEDCSGGEPSSCNTGCATLLVPFFADCQATLRASQGGTALVKVLQRTVDECMAVYPQCPCVEQSTGGALGTLPSGFAESYTVGGCADAAAHCGVYRRVAAHCHSGDRCPGGPGDHGNTDSTLCDGAPVYQRDPNGPVLYRYLLLTLVQLRAVRFSEIIYAKIGRSRYHYSDGGTRWWVGESAGALAKCENGPRNEGYDA